MDRVWRSSIGKVGEGEGKGRQTTGSKGEKVGRWKKRRRAEKSEVWRRARQIRRKWKKEERELAEEN